MRIFCHGRFWNCFWDRINGKARWLLILIRRIKANFTNSLTYCETYKAITNPERHEKFHQRSVCLRYCSILLCVNFRDNGILDHKKCEPKTQIKYTLTAYTCPQWTMHLTNLIAKKNKNRNNNNNNKCESLKCDIWNLKLVFVYAVITGCKGFFTL